MRPVCTPQRLILVYLIALVAPGASAASPAKPATHLRIGLYVFNYANVPDKIMRTAEKHVSRIFMNAGISLDWVEVNDPEYIPTCAADFDESPCCLLRIQRRLSPNAFPHQVAGYAIMGSPYATIAFESIEDEANIMARSQSLILGHTMAHEIGHVFLPAGYHSAEGIMKGRLDEKSWAKAERGMLLFSSKEGAWLRQNVFGHRRKTDVIGDLQP